MPSNTTTAPSAGRFNNATSASRSIGSRTRLTTGAIRSFAPPDTGGSKATSSPSCSTADAAAYSRFTATASDDHTGCVPPLRSCSSKCATVVPSGTVTASPADESRSLSTPKKRTRTCMLSRLDGRAPWRYWPHATGHGTGVPFRGKEKFRHGEIEGMAQPMLIAKQTDTKDELVLLPALTNRHGLVAGATGTGKTVTLQVIAEALSRIGVPVFAADVKGDLSGISQPGQSSPKLEQRLKTMDLATPAFAGCPVTFWDVFGEQGHPVRATVPEMGPLL